MTKLNKIAIRTISYVTLLTIVGKAFGFIRDALIAANFGSTSLADSYFAVAGITVLLAELIVNAALTTVIPVISEIKKEKGQEIVNFYISKFTTLIILMTFSLTLLGCLLAPWIIRLIASGFSEEQLEFAVRLFRWGLPSIICSGIVGVFAGYLQSENRFIIASSVRIIFNMLCILYLLFFSEIYGLIGLMAMTVIASFIQFIVIRYSIRSTGYHYQFSLTFKDPYIKRAIHLSLPVFLGIAIYDINNMIDRSFASTLQEGNVAQLTYAAKLEALIIGIFVTAIMTYFYPAFAKAYDDQHADQLSVKFNKAVNLNIILAVPATAGLYLFAEPIVQIMFERGAFDTTSTLMTARVLQFYALGILAKAMREVMIRIFYILHNHRIAFKNGLLMVMLNLILNILIVPQGKVELLALTTAISVFVSTAFLFFHLWYTTKILDLSNILNCFVKTVLATVLMGIFSKMIYSSICKDNILANNWQMFFKLALVIFLSVMIYFLLLWLFRLREMKELLKFLKERRKRS